MGCDMARREEILEGYLVGRLSIEESEAFETHFFECARCFDELQTLQAIQRELRQAHVTSRRSPARLLVGGWRAAVLAAAVVLAVGVLSWMRSSVPSGSPDAPTARRSPSLAQPSEQPRPALPAPTVASGPSLEQLARFEPPRYEPLRLRGVPDEATARFQRGMEQYRRADYAGAVDDLRAAVELDSDAAHARFFLGISYLLLAQDNAAIDQLRNTVALGDSAYLEDAHFFLAKAFLRREDLGRAETQLKRLIDPPGSRTADARHLLAEVQRLKGPSN
jgi:tetratricopeptide (TPR) repeat protein